MRRNEAITMGRALHGTFPILTDSVAANGCFLAYVEKRGSFTLAKNEKPFLSVSFKKPQRAQRTQRKQQLSVPSASSVVNLLCHNPSTRKKLKSHADSLLTNHGGI